MPTPSDTRLIVIDAETSLIIERYIHGGEVPGGEESSFKGFGDGSVGEAPGGEATGF